MIFDELIHRVQNDAPFPNRASMTAAEVFDYLKGQRATLHCQYATFLFVALARSVGTRAFAVQVEEACDGARTPHACAAVYPADGPALLVDPTYYWFGAPHRKFKVLDDIHAMAMHLAPFPDLRLNLIAAKLAPDLLLPQYNVCRGLIESGRWAEARDRLPLVAKLDTGGAITESLEATFAIRDGDTRHAVELLEHSIQLDPHELFTHAQLGKLLAAQRKFAAAREAFQEALHCPHTQQDEAALLQAIRDLEAQRKAQAGTGASEK
jgi:tetratricopeptide (TPR) repeat protein